MTTELWITVVAGMLFVVLSTVGFLAAVAYGLKRGKWLPALLVVVTWIIAMAAYSMWEGLARRDATHERHTLQVANWCGANLDNYPSL